MPLQATSGAASYDAFGGGVAAVPNYIEDVFSTWLYPSISGDNQIVNNIDLSGKGGLVWIKSRDRASNHYLIDTVRGSSVGDTKSLSSNTTTAQTSGPNLDWVQFNNNGFTAKAVAGGGELGTNTYYGNMASWTFREQPKFFDVVTFTYTGSSQTVAHSLAAVPGAVIMKRTDAAEDWCGWFIRTDFPTSGYTLSLNTVEPSTTTTPTSNLTSTTFKPGFVYGSNSGGTVVPTVGGTYVAHLFAHNAGGFGLTGTDNVISCGSFTTDGSGNASVNLGYETQWTTVKASSTTGNWITVDSMRGTPVGSTDQQLYPNLSNAESAGATLDPTATGFNATGLSASQTYIYIAIRRGPMKVPTDGTKVFSPNQTSATTGTAITTGFPVDWQLLGMNDGNVYNQRSSTRLTGVNTNGSSNSQYLVTSNTNAEAATGSVTLNWGSTGFQVPSLNSGSPTIFWNFRRAPGFFDEVCYTGTGSARTVAHNLAAVPELMIVKSRSTAYGWTVYAAGVGNTSFAYLNEPDAFQTNGTAWNNTSPTSSVFTVGTGPIINASGSTFAAYLFASCPGVSKVFNYTGNGSSQTINCGFTGGARFVMIKRTDSTGDWYVWDSARGIVSGNDPRLSLNTTAAEVTTDDSVDTDSTGFVVNQLSATNINVSSATYIGIAIA